MTRNTKFWVVSLPYACKDTFTLSWLVSGIIKTIKPMQYFLLYFFRVFILAYTYVCMCVLAHTFFYVCLRDDTSDGKTVGLSFNSKSKWKFMKILYSMKWLERVEMKTGIVNVLSDLKRFIMISTIVLSNIMKFIDDSWYNLRILIYINQFQSC